MTAFLRRILWFFEDDFADIYIANMRRSREAERCRPLPRSPRHRAGTSFFFHLP